MNGRQKRLIAVDILGFFETSLTRTNENVRNTIANEIFHMTSPYIHAFLIIFRIDRFTAKENNNIDFIRTKFGKDAAKYFIAIFTYEDQLDEGQGIGNFINSSSEWKELVKHCGNRTLAINNKISG